MKKLAIIASALLFCGSLSAQNMIHTDVAADGSLLSDLPDLSMLAPQPKPLDAPGWHFGLDATGFLRDASFNTDYTRGYTVTGFFVDPAMHYGFDSIARLTVGLHLTGAAGYDGLRAWKPLVRFEYQPQQWLRVVMGTLYGSLNHALPEPMLDRERWIYDHQEDGLQVLVNAGSRFQSDTWLYWEHLLESMQADQERFTLGSNNQLALVDGARLRLVLPFTFMGSHRGGSISTLDTCMQTLFTERLGLRLQYRPDPSRTFALEFSSFFFQDVSDTACLAFQEGWAVWPQVSYDRHAGEKLHYLASAGYWQGYQFVASRGSYLFQSCKWHGPDSSETYRQSVTARVGAEYNFRPGCAVGADAEAYYDLRHQELDFVFGVYMRFSISGR